MSKLDDLIKEYCPNGVEFARLDECCILEKGRTPIQKAIPGEYPLVVTTMERKSSNTYQFDKPTVCIPLVSSRGHGVASLNQIYYQEGKFALGNILCGVTPKDEAKLSARFLWYYLNHKKDTLIVPLMKGGANVSLTEDSLNRVKIPIPPILIQKYIIEKLNVFEDYIGQIQAELTARKQQYSYYRDRLLSSKCGYALSELKKCCEFQNGFAFKSSLFKESGKPILRIANIENGTISDSDFVYFNPCDYAENFDRYKVEHGDIVVAMSGATTGKIAYNYNESTYYLNQRVGKFTPDESKLNKRYLFHWLLSQSRNILAISSGTGAQPNLSSAKMMEMKIPLPPLDVQNRLAEVLDNFDAICSDLNIGLPAEIEARQKQYEYYRDALLTYAATGKIINSTVQYSTVQYSTVQYRDYNALIRICQYVFGVVFVELGDVIVSLNTGLNPRQFFKLNTDDATNYYVTIREIQNGNIVFSDKTDRINDEALCLCNNRSNLESGDVLFSGTGTIGETAVVESTPTNWNIKEGVYAIKPLQELLNSHYLMFLFQTESVRASIMKRVAGGTVKSIPMSEMRKISIPLPTIAVQKQLADTVSHFDRLCNDLTNGLPAEIEARQKQYEYYRDKLLTF